MSQKDDTISRQAAIDALKGLPTWWADEGGYYGGAQPPMVALLDPEDAVSAIENLPSAQLEQKIGKFIRWMEKREEPKYISYTPHCKCSLCENELLIENIKYCYMCGARLIEDIGT